MGKNADHLAGIKAQAPNCFSHCIFYCHVLAARKIRKPGHLRIPSKETVKMINFMKPQSLYINLLNILCDRRMSTENTWAGKTKYEGYLKEMNMRG